MPDFSNTETKSKDIMMQSNVSTTATVDNPATESETHFRFSTRYYITNGSLFRAPQLSP
jgi:hypothetical protein